MPPGIRLSSGLAAKAARESESPAKVSAIHASGTTRSPVKGHAAVEEQRAEPGQVAKACVDTAVEHAGANGVDADRGVELGAELAPQQLRHQLGHPTPLAASQIQPNTSVSQDRYWNGPPCGLLFQREQEVIHGGRQVRHRSRRPADGLFEQPDLRHRVEVVLGKSYPRTHVEQMSDRRARIA